MKTKLILGSIILLPLLTLSSPAFADRADALLGQYQGTTSDGKHCAFKFEINPYHSGEIDLYASSEILSEPVENENYFPLEFDLRLEIDHQLKNDRSNLVFHHERETMYDKTDDITVKLDATTGLPTSIQATQSGMGGDSSFDCDIQ